MYKTYIETKHENRDHLSPSEISYAGYLLTHPRIYQYLNKCDAQHAKIRGPHTICGPSISTQAPISLRIRCPLTESIGNVVYVDE